MTVLYDENEAWECLFLNAEWKTGILTEEKTMEMLYEWWRWICHSLCHAMTMTYKIQDTALSHALHFHRCNNVPTTCVAAKCEQSNFHMALPGDTASHQTTVGHFVWSDYWSLQSGCRSALLAKTKASRPKTLRPLDAFHTKSYSRHISGHGSMRVSLRRGLVVFSGKTADARSDWLTGGLHCELSYCVELFTRNNSAKFTTFPNKRCICLPNMLTHLSTQFHLRAKCRSRLSQDRQAEWESILLWFGGESPSTVQ